MTPPKFVLALFPPTVNVVAVPAPVLPKTRLLEPAPLLASDAIAGVKPVRLTVAVPLLGFISKPALPLALLPRGELPLPVNVPALTVVSPV